MSIKIIKPFDKIYMYDNRDVISNVVVSDTDMSAFSYKTLFDNAISTKTTVFSNGVVYLSDPYSYCINEKMLKVDRIKDITPYVNSSYLYNILTDLKDVESAITEISMIHNITEADTLLSLVNLVVSMTIPQHIINKLYTEYKVITDFKKIKDNKFIVSFNLLKIVEIMRSDINEIGLTKCDISSNLLYEFYILPLTYGLRLLSNLMDIEYVLTNNVSVRNFNNDSLNNRGGRVLYESDSE